MLGENKNPQACPGQDDLWAESGLFPASSLTRGFPTKGKGGQNPARGLCWAVGNFSSRLSEHGFNLKSRPNICSQRTPACCRCLQTPEVKNQEQCSCEPCGKHILCEWIPLNPQCVLLNSECPDFSHKYTSSISLSSTYTSCKSWENQLNPY